MAKSSPLEADPKDVFLASGAMAAVGLFAMFVADGFEIGVIVLGLAVLMVLIGLFQRGRN